MKLPIVTEEVYQSLKASYGSTDSYTEKELYEDICKEQPLFKNLMVSVLVDDRLPQGYKNGFCNGMVLVWHLFKQQMIINDLEDDEEYRHY